MLLQYRGRFAPTPSGQLHLGSLVAAVSSYVDARAHTGQWLVRIDDIDIQRAVPGSADSILRTLERFGLHWDGEIVYQSHRQDVYSECLNRLQKSKYLFNCACSRTDIASRGRLNFLNEHVYPGTCYSNLNATDFKKYSVRVHWPQECQHIEFTDQIQGPVIQNLAIDSGDLVLQRADKVFSYPFVVAIDDAMQGITHVVRGMDLLHQTPRQIAIQKLLNFSQAKYAHVPLIVDSAGFKLGKQTQAPAVENENPSKILFKVLSFLKLNPPLEIETFSVDKQLLWAVENWNIENLARISSIVV